MRTAYLPTGLATELSTARFGRPADLGSLGRCSQTRHRRHTGPPARRQLENRTAVRSVKTGTASAALAVVAGSLAGSAGRPEHQVARRADFPECSALRLWSRTPTEARAAP